MHNAFDSIFESEGDAFSVKAINSEEADTYRYMSDILDYWAAGPNSYKGSLKDNIVRWRDEQKQSFVEQVRTALEPLSQVGMKFLYPVQPLIEKQLIGLCLGYELISITDQAEQVDHIAACIAKLNLDYSFLYLIPTIQGQIWSEPIRIGKDTLQRLIGGEQVPNRIYTVAIPEGISAVLPMLNIEPLRENTLLLPFRRVYIRLKMIRNELHFARSRLSRENLLETRLLEYYENRAEELRQEQLLNSDHAHKDANEFDDAGPAREEWENLWSTASAVIQHLADFTTIDLTTMPEPVVAASELDANFQRYWTRKYFN